MYIHAQYANKQKSRYYCELCIIFLNTANVCDSSPCQNGGTCSVTSAGAWSCSCRPGYSGNACSCKCTNHDLSMKMRYMHTLYTNTKKYKCEEHICFYHSKCLRFVAVSKWWRMLGDVSRCLVVQL